ncbi:AfsR/SARP family transcriptional regulator [Streptomyces montanisoli]|uniref:AfsR/SARP family transcriptional regulator n=1 Tax=Streptomyces montanisoli TaxID=2798581 RepID=A0A940MCJ3_9ACTN|nr:BTAD domain-containing putative transcriptional regulator [Streptomyces montanisoli]MBP0460484.1 AfsR/SARP family transcriptional regulator [Streptomyces montanisoli]
MRYGILGTTRALHDDGIPVAIGGARLRALLTSLAMRPGRTVPVGVLVAEVWDGDPPADGIAALQALVGRLRRALGHDAIASAEGGYRLCADEDEVDGHRFVRLTAEGVRALETGDPVKASTLLADALALWQGPALADLPDRGGDASRLETRRQDAHRTALAAALALGKADEALPELAALCEQFPLDERLHALRVRALRDSGRPAEALAAYEETRRLLATRLGTDPGPELCALHSALLAGDGPSAADGSPAADGSGRPESRTPEAPPAPSAPAAVPAPPGNLRARLTSFVGRQDDIEALHGDLARSRLVTLTGPGGSGKTRLSQEAAEAAGGPSYPDGVWLAELAPVEDPDGVPEAVLGALRARETVLRGAGAESLRAADPHADDPLESLVEHLARRRVLLVLDNCEHVVDAAAALAEVLLTRCPGLSVVATSREPLGVPGEVVRPVEPLPPVSAFRLFAERGSAARSGFDAEGDPEAVGEICRRLDGLPLAIELAAARLRLLTPRQIADRLDDRFRLLTGGSRTVLPRQQTLRAVVDWSWELLDEPERAVLRRLSVFAGGCDLAAAETVCADPAAGVAACGEAPAPGSRAGDSPGRAAGGNSAAAPHGHPVVHGDDVAAVLGSLIDKSLVIAVPGTDPGAGMRYRLLETVAEYAAQRLDQAGERGATERAHVVHYRELARNTDLRLRGHGQRAALDLLRREWENLRTAMRRAHAAGDEQELLCFVLSLGWYWQMLDQRAEARHWAGLAVEFSPDPFAPPAAPAPPIHERCTDAPPPMRDEVLAEARREVWLFRMLQAEFTADGWLAGQQEWLSNVTRVYRAGLPQTCRYPGTFWLLAMLFTGDIDRLLAGLDATVEACERLGYDWDLASVLQMRANVMANRSLYAESAARDADRALVIFERLGDDWGAAESLSARGEAHERLGRFEDAVDDFARAVGHAEGLGAGNHVALLKVRLGQNLFELARGAEGEEMIRGVLAAGEEGGATGHDVAPVARMSLALQLGRAGRRAEARALLLQAKELLSTGPVMIFRSLVLSGLAWLDTEDGAYAQAREGIRAVLVHAEIPMSELVAPEMSAVHLLIAARALAGLATAPGGAAGEGGEHDEHDEHGEDRDALALAHDAARLVGAYERLVPEGHVRASFEKELYEVAWRDTLSALSGDTAAHAQACERGAALTMAEARALV